MKANVGTMDRMVRIVVGVALLAAGGIFQSWWGLVGLLPLLTGLMRFCALYSLLGINTCPLKKS